MEQLARKYTYRVGWSQEDEEFVATVVEFPSLSWLEEDQGAALEGIVHLVCEVLTDMEERGEEPPVPLVGYVGCCNRRQTTDNW